MKLPISLCRISLVVFTAAILILTGCAPQTQVWPANGKSYPVSVIGGKRYLSIPPEEYLLQRQVPVPVAPSTNGVSIIVSLSSQRVWLYKNGTLYLMSVCCPGAPGHETPTGTFHVIDKEAVWTSTLYHCSMPYLLRLNTPQEDIGLHQGYICAAPASHGCIRLPADKAEAFFESVPIGSEVVINP